MKAPVPPLEDYRSSLGQKDMDAAAIPRQEHWPQNGSIDNRRAGNDPGSDQPLAW